MHIVHTVAAAREHIKKWRKEECGVGFVPTMGYLHEGHESLIKKAAAENEKVVVSIFVNPMQFAPTEDFDSYPRDLQKDAALCEKAGVNLIFQPDAAEMYGNNFHTFVDMDGLTGNLCGKSRPGHFRGVCTVVAKLLNIITPDRAYFGQKDAQQLAVIKRMAGDLNMDAEIIGCPIVREPDGLAKSSRNTYLNPAERKAALVLSQAVFAGERLVKEGERDAGKLIAAMEEIIRREPLAKIDYVEIVDCCSIEKINVLHGSVLAAIAVFIGKTRLIDNFICEI